MNRPAAILLQLETSLAAAPESLAHRFGVSSRTVAADIAQLNQLLGASGSIRLQDGSYRLRVVDFVAFRDRRQRILGEGGTFNDPSWRAGHILATLFSSLVPIRIEDLGLSMKIGRTTVVADLAAIRAALAEYRVQITGRTRVGLRLEGHELDLRMAVLKLAFEQAFGEVDLGPEIDRVLHGFATDHHFDAEFLSTLRQWLIVLLGRHLDSYTLSDLPAGYTELAGSSAHRLAGELAELLRPLIAEQLPEPEVLFLAIPLAGMRTPTAGHVLAQAPVTAEGLVTLIMERINSRLDLDIDPASLSTAFAHHVGFMLNRLQYSLEVEEGMAPHQFETAYPLAHKMATIAAEVITERTGLVMDEAELSLAGTYFQVFLEEHAARRSRDIRVGVLTGRGPGVARLICSQLTPVFPRGTVFTIHSGNARAETLGDLDLVVTTPGSQAVTTAPVIELAEIFDRGELVRKLQRMGLSTPLGLDFTPSSGSLLVSLLDETRFVALPAGSSYSEAVEFLVELLITNGLVPGGFRQALAERESRSSMQLGELIAFPHATAAGSSDLVCAMGVIPHADAEPGLRLVLLMSVPDKQDYDDTLLIRAWDELIRLGNNRGLVNRLSRLTSYEQLFYLMESVTHTTGH